MSFSDAQKLRSDLLALGRRTDDPLPDKASSVAKKLASEIDRSMESAAKRRGGDALEAWRDANQFWKEGKDIFNSKLIKKIASEDPDLVSKMLFTQSRGRPVVIKRIMDATKESPEVQDAIRGEVLSDLIFKSTNQEGEFVGKSFLNQLKQFGGKGRDSLKALFPRGEIDAIERWANVKNLVISGQPDQTGRLAVQIGQLAELAGIAGLVTSGMTGSATGQGISGTILIVPSMLARMFTNKKIAKFMSEGFTGKTAQAASRSIGQFFSLLARENIDFEFPESPQTPFSGLAQSFGGR